VAGPHNAAADFVEDGVNGYRAADAGPVALAHAIVEVSKNADSLRRSTAAWFKRFEPTFTIESSIVQIEQIYRAAVGASASQRM
jgi:glycosyltransferase involved in cell wall biosynthesis